MHSDTAVALARWCLWTGDGALDLQAELRIRLQTMHSSFMHSATWPGTEVPVCHVLPVEVPYDAQTLGLTSLLLDGQGMTVLPEAVGSLERLEVLRARRNLLSVLPACVGRLSRLRELLLANNLLEDLPDELANLPKLQILGAEGNRLSKLPAVVYKFKKLLSLGLDEQRCTMIVSQDQKLPASVLSTLRARGCANSFPDLAAPLNASTNLNTVFWANNALPSVPAALVQFGRSLKLLDLAHNHIEAIGEEVFQISSLRDLSLAGNRLQEVPTAIGRARGLQQLWLHGNRLTSLPEEIGDLENLAIFELHHNRIAALPSSMSRLKKLNWLFAHGNELTDGAGVIQMLGALPRLKICGLGANKLDLFGMEFKSLRASFGLAWNRGLDPADGVLSETLTTCDFFWDQMVSGAIQDTLVITCSAQGAPIAQGQAEVRALRDSLLKVDALYICDPANAWFLQDPDFGWAGLPYFERKVREVTSKYKHVFIWGGSMGGSASLLFAQFADCVHAFSPQVDLRFTWPSFASDDVRELFRSRVQESIAACRGTVNVHVGEENHTDVRHASALPAKANVFYHDTANHNTMKHLKQRDKLLPLLKFEITRLLIAEPAAKVVQ
eukprot:TRINITY_DN18608_c0_g4_i1.p1 TRINITY_DN18608_c0_g4~~TRINITY_DN18608_c0_g4_i1.p1  ORF type:complete len:612 (-),score=74.44 TRINITY_DN18608_c0_g4_i1:199-2034(-)